MQSQKISTYIGFAVKAGDVVFGLDNILTSKRRIRVIVTDKSLGSASLRKLNNYLVGKDIKVITLEDMSLGANILRRDKCKIIGVLNVSLADAIIDVANKD